MQTDAEIARRSGGFDLQRIEQTSMHAITLVARARRMGALRRIEFRVAPEPPHMIEMIRIESADPPADNPDLPFVLDAQARAKIIESVVLELNRAYVFPDQAVAMGRTLQANVARQAYDTLDDPEIFARALTEDLRGVSHDKHLRVEVRTAKNGPSSDGPPRSDPSVIGEVKRLAGNVAYVEILSFGLPPVRAQKEVRDAPG